MSSPYNMHSTPITSSNLFEQSSTDLSITAYHYNSQLPQTVLAHLDSGFDDDDEYKSEELIQDPSGTAFNNSSPLLPREAIMVTKRKKDTAEPCNPQLLREVESEVETPKAAPLQKKTKTTTATAALNHQHKGKSSAKGKGHPEKSPAGRPVGTTSNKYNRLSSGDRLRKAPKMIIPGTQIGNTLDELTEGDRLLLTMRDAGETWTAITEAYTELTGVTPGESTLPNRYTRLLLALKRFTNEDDTMLLEAKRGVEAIFEAEKWSMVAEAMARIGASSGLGGMGDNVVGGLKVSPEMCKRRFEEICDGQGPGGRGASRQAEAEEAVGRDHGWQENHGMNGQEHGDELEAGHGDSNGAADGEDIDGDCN